jgi:hypothetical protein
MTMSMRTTKTTTALMTILLAGTFAMAREQPPEKDKPVQPAPAPAPTEPPKEEPRPSLDELLGLPGSGQGPLDDPSKTDLDRVLSGAEIGNAFRQAVTLMGDVATRMGESRDAGLTTQRMQETILRRLDQLISSLEQQQQQQQQQSSQQQQQQQSSANQRVPKQQQSQENNENQGDNTGQTTLPDRKDGELGRALDAARAGWGNLPDRVREMLVQGTNDHFSNIYKELTASYYKKLAEEAK